jgi:hypothetical protein
MMAARKKFSIKKLYRFFRAQTRQASLHHTYGKGGVVSLDIR